MRCITVLSALALLTLSACQPQQVSSPTAPAASSASAKQSSHRVYSYSPPGVFKFDQREIYRGMSATPARIMALYPVKLEDGSSAHLIVLEDTRDNDLWSVVQPDVKAFTLRPGEQVISIRYSRYSRIFPFKAPPATTGN